jgi:hypothetical protein
MDLGQIVTPAQTRAFGKVIERAGLLPEWFAAPDDLSLVSSDLATVRRLLGRAVEP